jgi:hypothetical protein
MLRRTISTSAQFIPMSFTASEYDHYRKHAHKAKYPTPEQEDAEYASITTKICTKCKTEKPLNLYNGNTSGADPFDRHGIRLRRPECGECTKTARKGNSVAKKVAKDTGIPFAAPEGTCCGICQKPQAEDNKLVFDHCHTTERFRGYLCNSCNRSVGVLGDDVAGILRVLNYLNGFEKLPIVHEDGVFKVSP